jgi:16S rRNA C967 or C1407 C5-methylase (RsmB/RsmF family)
MVTERGSGVFDAAAAPGSQSIAAARGSAPMV